MSNTRTYKTEYGIDQTEYLQKVYYWAVNYNKTLSDILVEITTAGFTDDEVGRMVREIATNETFNIR